MRKRKWLLLLIGVLALAGLALGGWRYVATHPQAVQQLSTAVAPSDSAGPLVVSGFIEADEISVAAELGGRITALLAEEGLQVGSGAVLAELDRSVTEAELAVAQAEVESARATVAWIKAGPRGESIRQAEAAVTLAEAYRDQAYQTWQDAKRLVAQQQTLDLQITQAQAQVAVAQENLKAAAAAKDAVQIAKDKFEQDVESLKKKWGDKFNAPSNPYLNQWWLGWVGVNSAEASYQGAVALLNNLKAEKNWPVAQLAQMHAAEAAYNAALAGVDQAQARLTDLRAGATAEQIAAGEAQVAVAEAQVAAIQARLKKLTLTAPAAGVVLARTVYTGELAAPGAPLFTLADLDAVSLVVYVPETKLNLVRLGQKMQVQVDSFPQRVFEGEVVRIADQAEFIPDKVQAYEERVALVFAVKIHLLNPEHLLKPGMPADAPLEQP
jgi:HlyD family secretion protein